MWEKKWDRFCLTFSTNNTSPKRKRIDTHKVGKRNRKLLKKQSRYMNQNTNSMYRIPSFYCWCRSDLKVLYLGLNMHIKRLLLLSFFKFCELVHLPCQSVPAGHCEASWPAEALGWAYSPPADAVSPDTASPSEALLNPWSNTQNFPH